VRTGSLSKVFSAAPMIFAAAGVYLIKISTGDRMQRITPHLDSNQEPAAMNRMVASKDSKKLARVTHAFLQMKKCGIANVERAYAGE
jgi:hypothetical protein